ncbi:uncharacterized protein EI90DRAFT_3085665, partial [Cantharellus anzutake]|uniref:uncharacterized protein n=1 Tax=Cantharellus anzutake TaxID=1750568 RepID=UPI001903497B
MHCPSYSRRLNARYGCPFGSVLSGANVPPAIGPGAPGYKKLFADEKDNLQFAEEQYKWVFDGVETGVLEQWGKIRAI